MSFEDLNNLYLRTLEQRHFRPKGHNLSISFRRALNDVIIIPNMKDLGLVVLDLKVFAKLHF